MTTTNHRPRPRQETRPGPRQSSISRPPRPRQRPSQKGRQQASRPPNPRWRRPLTLAVGSAGAVLAVVAGLVTLAAVSPSPPTAAESQAPASVVRETTGVPLGRVLAASSNGVVAPAPVVPGGPPLTLDGKRGVLFVSEESCPFCAAERWAVVVALSQFGNWQGLGATTSAANDVYPDTATFSFRSASFSSDKIGFSSAELFDNRGRRLQKLSPLQKQLVSKYDVPPYVDSAAQSGSVPFLDIDNRFVLAGAQYSPALLAGLTVTQIAAQLSDPQSPIAVAVEASAGRIVAAISQIVGAPPQGAPGSPQSS